MADEQDILLREIDEELKQESLQKIWKKYGTLIIGGSLLLVGCVAGFKGWQAYEKNNRIAIGERFSEAQKLATAHKKDAAQDSFDSISQESATGYQMLSQFQLATLATKNSDWASAIRLYKAIANNEAFDTIYRELAIILGAFAELDSLSGDIELIEKANQLAVGSGPWRFSAKEIGAIAALVNGDNIFARTQYNELSKEASAPEGLRARAKKMLELLAN